jgi:hypothetical protein
MVARLRFVSRLQMDSGLSYSPTMPVSYHRVSFLYHPSRTKHRGKEGVAGSNPIVPTFQKKPLQCFALWGRFAVQSRG